ncbi:prepilin-type N-terminal cleavage/methylation domain-containing protein [Providencia rustigianii]|uniref:prepilin-type N-terminal cleavage/methylation domain-containing protein n=1 Tax=Providencia rustigianii TaxID=158850 RepID=UPI000F6C22BC|nr:Pilin [Providencia rustigianii]
MNQKGFSLIEIMVVIAIISILSAIAIPGYQGYMQKAAMTDVLQTLLSYKNSVELCSFNQGSFLGCNGGKNNIPSGIKGKYLKILMSNLVLFIFQGIKH